MPSRTIWVTARQPLGLRSSAGTGKLAAALLTRTRAGPSASSSASKAAATSSARRMSAPACAARPPTASTAADAGQAVSFVARQDPHRRAQPGELDGDGLAQAGPAPGDDDGGPVEGARREHGWPRRGWLGKRHGGYLPSKTTGCFLALAAYPAGMSSETNSMDELMAPKRIASVKPR